MKILIVWMNYEINMFLLVLMLFVVFGCNGFDWGDDVYCVNCGMCIVMVVFIDVVECEGVDIVMLVLVVVNLSGLVVVDVYVVICDVIVVVVLGCDVVMFDLYGVMVVE